MAQRARRTIFPELCWRARIHNAEGPRTQKPEALPSVRVTLLVLLSRRGRAFRVRPRTVGELQHQQAVILARRPQCSTIAIKMHLRRAPVRSTGLPVAAKQMVRALADIGR